MDMQTTDHAADAASANARAEAEVILANTPTLLNRPLARAIEDVEAIGPGFRAADALETELEARVTSLCGDMHERKKVEDGGRSSIPLPDALRVKERVWITKLEVRYSDGSGDKDFSASEPPVIEIKDYYALDRHCGDDKALRRKLGRVLQLWYQAKNDAWNAPYNAEQKAAYAALREAQHDRRLQADRLVRAINRLLKAPARTPSEIAAKVHCWANAWGIIETDGKIATSLMDPEDSQDVLAVIGADLLRMRNSTGRPGRVSPSLAKAQADAGRWKEFKRRLKDESARSAALDIRIMEGDQSLDEDEDRCDAVRHAIIDEIENTPATTLAALEVKALAVLECYGAGSTIEDIHLGLEGQGTTDVRLAKQIVQTLAQQALL
jgi:hypothetical protein